MTGMIRYVTVRRFSEASGYTEHAIRTKIRDGVWREGQEWVKAPDGRILIDAEGYNAWAAGGATALPMIGRSPPPMVGVAKRRGGR